MFLFFVPISKYPVVERFPFFMALYLLIVKLALRSGRGTVKDLEIIYSTCFCHLEALHLYLDYIELFPT